MSTVRFNTSDYRMLELARESKLNNLKTKNNTFIYGMRMYDNRGEPVRNPWVRINTHHTLVPATLVRLRNRANKLKTFLGSNGISVDVTATSGVSGEAINIGIRRDLRDHPVFAAALVQTIVYFLEGRLEIPEGYTLHNVPQLTSL